MWLMLGLASNAISISLFLAHLYRRGANCLFRFDADASVSTCIDLREITEEGIMSGDGNGEVNAGFTGDDVDICLARLPTRVDQGTALISTPVCNVILCSLVVLHST